MRRALFLAAASIVVLFGKNARAQTTDVALQRSLVVLETKSWDAWKARDSAFFRSFLSDDHVEIQPGGIANKNTVIGGVGSPACTVKGYSIGSFKLTKFSESAALLTYRATQETECNGVAVPSPVWVSSLYILRDGRWQNAAYQHTQAATPPPKM